MEFDARITFGQREGNRQPMALTLLPSGLKKYRERSQAFAEGLSLIEGTLYKELPIPATAESICINFFADDADLADDEANDIKELFLSQLRMTVHIQGSDPDLPRSAAA
ncbi:MAG TPA: hypothetical protein VHO23_02955 [Candidatus Paceibacterota bacterium]|nr:hypothetical protein [Candidatus Paceibacterota bacterium]